MHRHPAPPRFPTGERPALIWVDDDGEFLDEDGFGRRGCQECSGEAVAKLAGRYRCRAHLPAGTTLPGWVPRER